MNLNDLFTQLALETGRYPPQPGGCSCPNCVPPAFGFGYSPFGFPTGGSTPGNTRYQRPSDSDMFAGYDRQPDQARGPPSMEEQEAELRERMRRENAERQRAFELEEARLQAEEERYQSEADAQLRAAEEEAEREQEELEAQLAELKREEKEEKRQVRKEKGKRFLKNVWNEVNGTNHNRRNDEYIEYWRRNNDQLQRLKREGGYLPDGRYVVPETRYHTAYAMKPGDKPPLNLRADIATGKIGRMFGVI